MPRHKRLYPDNLAEMYKSGLSFLELSNSLGISRNSIKDRLIKLGVQIRTPSEQHIIRNARYTPEQRKQNAAAAHASNRGRSASLERMTKRAITRMRNAKMSSKEMAWHVAFAACGITTVPEYAVGVFNVDLAIPEHKVAIEVQGSWHLTARKAAQDQKKRQYLELHGWSVYEVKTSDMFPKDVKAMMRKLYGTNCGT